jgi:glycosyltransferase involved in cell wall biosynthesis
MIDLTERRAVITGWPADWQVPAFRAATFTPRRRDIALCVFVLNEGERIRRQLSAMPPHCRDVDLIVADGGSTDGALDTDFLRDCSVRSLLAKTGPGRLSAQMRMALAWCLVEGYRGVIVMDGNDKDDPAAIGRFVAARRAGVDHVQGSRFRPGGRGINTPWSRWLGLRFVHAPALSVAAGRSYSDTTNGFRAYSRRLLLDPRVAPFRDCFNGYELHYYLAIRAARLGYRVREVPVVRAYPRGAPAPTKIHGWRGHFGVLKALWSCCIGELDPPANSCRRAA